MSNAPIRSPQGDIEPAGHGQLEADDFTEFFRDVHGYDPFPWQQRLTTSVIRNRSWPKVIDLPTGTGKTAVLDTAIFAMAAQPAISPRRVVFVIDRRIVVDQVCKRAQRIRDRIREGNTSVLRIVRERLENLSGGAELGVAALRGGVPVDDDWIQSPDRPWVLVSTVDQFGSRLLFRGYGVTPGMRPIHAGLAGNDCLVVLDEVHISVPFSETLDHVAEFRGALLPSRFSVVEMSATPKNNGVEPFRLDHRADLNDCDELRRRVKSPKKATLMSVQKPDSIPAAVSKILRSIAKDNQKADYKVGSVGIVVNRVRTARETHAALKRAGFTVHLVTGRMRPLDRIELLDRIFPVIDPNAACGGELAAVVATQAIEVGADFSFDALITECAPIDSLRQRFGRLDRRGSYSGCTGDAAQAWIIGPKSVVATKRLDPIYGGAVKATWDELTKRVKESQSNTLDVGTTSLLNFPHQTLAPKANAPLLLRSHIDAWVQTRPEPLVQPPIEWFLHGLDQNRSAEVSILWRWDRTSEALRLVPPRQAEFLQIPIDAAKSWLLNDVELDVADVPQAHSQVRLKPETSDDTNAKWVRWINRGRGAEGARVEHIRAGDVLVVDPDKGGLCAGTWDPSSTEPVADLGDWAQIAYGRRATLRLDERLDEVDSPPTPARDAEDSKSRSESIANWLDEQARARNNQLQWLRESISKLKGNFKVSIVGSKSDDSVDGYYVLIQAHSVTRKPVIDIATLDGTDEAGSQTGAGTRLDRHMDGVGERAGKMAGRLSLPEAIKDDLILSGRLHDLGKIDSRFQLQLVGGDRVEYEMCRDSPLAKSLPGAARVQRYPKGMRHEFASVAMIESNRDVLDSAHDKDLVLHLVGTHHGFGRPLPSIIEDSDPQALSYVLDGHRMAANSSLADSSLALEMADRFWLLVRRYGYHGLAWLEAILRLADHQQSAWEAGQE